jgi:hypothetical protein
MPACGTTPNFLRPLPTRSGGEIVQELTQIGESPRQRRTWLQSTRDAAVGLASLIGRTREQILQAIGEPAHTTALPASSDARPGT